MFALLNAVLVNAYEYAETNRMPAQIHNLMKTEGLFFIQRFSAALEPAPQSLRHYAVVERPGFRFFELTPEKKGWRFWDNSNIKSLHRNTGAATASLTQFEYDIYYPFYFQGAVSDFTLPLQPIQCFNNTHYE